MPFSVVCFRAVPAGLSHAADLDAFNQRLLDAVNATGEVFLSHTRLNGVLTLRLAIGHLRTTERARRARVGRCCASTRTRWRPLIVVLSRSQSLMGTPLRALRRLLEHRRCSSS